MNRRTSFLPFFLVEGLVLLLVVVPVAHLRSFVERFALPVDVVPLAPDETAFIILRALLLVLVMQSSFALRDLYRWTVILQPQQVAVRMIEAVIIASLAAVLLYVGMGEADMRLDLGGTLLRLRIHPLLVLGCGGASFLVAYLLRMRWPRWVARSRFAERLAIAGEGHAVDVLEEEIRRRRLPGLELVGFLGAHARNGRRMLGEALDLDAVVQANDLQLLVLEPSLRPPSQTLLSVREKGCKIVNAPEFYEQLSGRVAVETLSGSELFLSPTAGLQVSGQLVKRGLDLVLATGGLLVALPLCALVALALKLDSRGPVFYSQERVGEAGRRFLLTKFRSMRVDAESTSGPVWAAADDDRITRVGGWLRKLRIDEVPQLWSVIRNDMSLVGPRPERPFFVRELEDAIPNYSQRHIVKPGVTGWAQINHSYGNTVDDAFIKLQYDLYYIKNRSFALDITILLRTVKVVVLQQGAV